MRTDLTIRARVKGSLTAGIRSEDEDDMSEKRSTESCQRRASSTEVVGATAYVVVGEEEDLERELERGKMVARILDDRRSSV